MPSKGTLALVGGVAAFALAAGIYLGSSQDPQPAASPVATTPPTAAPPETFTAATATTPAPTAGAPTGAVLSLKVAANSGGTRKAADGYTRMGFPRTCAGAVAAAASYYTFGNAPVTSSVRTKVANQITRGTSPGLQTFRTNAGDIPGVTFKTDPAQGGFLVTDCTGSGAVVSLFFCTRVTSDGETRNICRSMRLTMDWFSTDGDWKVTDVYAGNINGPDFWHTSKAWTNPLSAAERGELLTKAGPGWTEFTDAPG